VREIEGFAGTNVTALIAGDVAAIDAWLDKYSIESSQPMVKRETGKDHGFLWSVGTPYRFACECYYDQRRNGFVEIRMVTKTQAQTVLERWNDLANLATKSAFQPHGVRQSGFDISVGSFTDALSC